MIERSRLESFVGPILNLFGRLLEPLARFFVGLWRIGRHLGSIFGHLPKVLGVQGSFGLIFNKCCMNFGSQNQSKNRSAEAAENEVVSETHFN